MTDKPAHNNGDDEPQGGFSDLTPEEFLAKTADGNAKEAPADQRAASGAGQTEAAAGSADLAALAAERTEDLQRLQAEYANYKKRVDRDRDVSRAKGVESVVRDLVPVLDAIHQAEAHGELTGGFKLVADALEGLAAAHGLEVFGEVGEEFDPHFHEALYQVPVPGDGEMHIQEVMQKGVRVGDSLVRPARVAVSVPNGEPAADADDAAQASDDPGTQTPGTQAPATDTPGTGTGN